MSESEANFWSWVASEVRQARPQEGIEDVAWLEELIQHSRSMYEGARMASPLFVSAGLVALAWYINAIVIAAAMGVFLFFESLGYGFIAGEPIAKELKKEGNPGAGEERLG